MRNQLLLGVALIVAAVVGYLLFGRRGGDRPAAVAVVAEPGKPAVPAPPPSGRPEDERPGSGGAAAPRDAVEQDDDPAGTLTLEGQVIDRDERPVPGALVSLSSNPPRSVKTEGDGSFSFDKLVGRTYTVAARKDDLVGGPAAVRLTAKTEPVVLRLAATGGLEITVVAAEDRKPVAGATVEVDEELEIAGTTGADGKVLLRGVPGGWHAVQARADGFAPTRDFVETSGKAGATDKQTFELKRGARVSGRVVDSTGKPVAGAKVRATAASSLFDPQGRRERLTTDDKGAWSFPALPAGTFRFTATHDKLAPGSSAPIALDGKSERKDVLITLEPGGRVAGKVVQKDGTPVASAALRIVAGGAAFGWEMTRQAYSDDAGRFDVAGLPRKKLELVAVGERASSDQVGVDLESVAERLDVTVTLDVEGAIAGIVVDTKGAPVPEAQVMAVPEIGGGRRDPARWGLRGLPRDVTDSGGRFELTGLTDGAYLVRAARGNVNLRDMMMRNATTAKVGDKDVRIVLENDGRVKGRVLYADGTPPEVYFVSVGYGRGAPQDAKDGAFELDAPAGKVMLSVSGPSFVQKTLGDVVVKAGETTDVGTINVEKGRSISGRVLRPDGYAVEGAKVVAGPQLIGSGSELSQGGLFGGGGLKSATSDENGNFVLSGVKAGGMVIAADHADGRSSMVRLPPGDDSVTIDLVLRPAGALEGKVTSDGKPVTGTMVMASPQQAARGNLMVQTGEDGSYKFDKLASDTYRVSALERAGMMGGGLHTKVVTIEPEKTAHLDLEIPVGGIAVTLKVAAPPGVTVTTAQLFLISGRINPTTVDQMMDSFGELGPGAVHQGFMLKGEPMKLANVAPGTYSACGIPIPGDINSPADMMKIRDQMNKLLVACQPVTVATKPLEQEITVSVPAPPAL